MEILVTFVFATGRYAVAVSVNVILTPFDLKLLHVTMESGLYHELLSQSPCTSTVNRLRCTPIPG